MNNQTNQPVPSSMQQQQDKESKAQSETKETESAQQITCMEDLGLPASYGPLFSRDHLRGKKVETLRIALSAAEEESFSLIARAINDRRFFPSRCVVRCAGGWVRDKLLGIARDSADRF